MKLTSTLAAAATALAVTLAPVPAHAQTEDPFDHAAPDRAPRQPSERRDAAGGSSDEAIVYRVAGDTRISTAIEASLDVWGDYDDPDYAARAVVLSRSDDYADALGGSALAGAAYAPLLLTPTASLHPAVEAEIVRLLGPAMNAGPIYVLGGTSAVSTAVTDRLEKDLGYTVVRLDGVDRYETSVTVARQTAALLPYGMPWYVFATTGRNFPDGLAAGATAGAYLSTVVLTRDTSVPGSVATYIEEMRVIDADIITVGGQAAAALTQDFEIVGSDRYQTARKVADIFWGDPATRGGEPQLVGLATGLNWPDALAGGANVAGYGPLLLTRTESLPGATAAAVATMVNNVDTTPIRWGVVFGGSEVVADGVMAEFDALLNPVP